ncbi:MAG: hypothetical protein JWO90_1611 [Solirubrobacterales bacterium]|nr:hypothetical protein [Solirubrobacterales bacterium]
MSAPRLVAGLLGFAVLALSAMLLTGGGDDSYHLKLRLANAGGLRDGSAVSMGGVRVGEVDLTLEDDDRVLVDAKIDKGRGPVPKDASIGISAVNFLGQKQVSIVGGDPANPAPSGFEVPAGKVTVSTDLDQVLNALDTDTRARLTILLNEAGGAVVGRRWDIDTFMEQVPGGLVDLRALVDQLSTDNTTLAELLASSNRFVATTTRKKAELTRMVDALGGTAETVATKRAELRATLAQAPETLATLQRFLGDLRTTTVPLGPAARDLTAAAPALRETLAQISPFTQAARPALGTATKLAPSLTRLGTQATPVIREAGAPVRALAALSEAAPPLTDALQDSADNLVAILENWSRAIQLRDGVGHVFRGEATASPNLVLSALDRLGKPASQPKGKAKAERGGTSVPAPSSPSSGRAPAPATKVPDLPGVLGRTLEDTQQGVKAATDAVKDVLGAAAGPPKSGGSTSPPDPPAADLLDFLLGP